MRSMKLEKGDIVTEYVILFILQFLSKFFGLKNHVITYQKSRAYSKALLESHVSKCTYYCPLKAVESSSVTSF